MSDRREFLAQIGTAGIVALGGLPPAMFCRAARASRALEASPDGKILVLVQLAGGNDGLNTIVPYKDDEYYKARPGIAIDKQAALPLNDDVALHPAATGLKELFDDGQLAIIQGVGYPDPDRSHFRSTDIWHSARPDSLAIESGWIGRALDLIVDEHAGEVPALALGTERLPLALVSSKISVPTVRSLADYQLNLGGGSDASRNARKELLKKLAKPASGSGADLEFLRSTSQTAISTSSRIAEVVANYKPAYEYPENQLAQRLKTVAQMISGELAARIYFVSLGGFDTHAQQSGAHQALLTELSTSVHAFITDLGEHDLADRVALVTYSEFGRRVRENGSLGTDHGAASQMFVAGGAVKPGIHGAHPSLTDLDRGDLKFHTDFRSVYATLLSDWLGIESEPVLGGRFPSVGFV